MFPRLLDWRVEHISKSMAYYGSGWRRYLGKHWYMVRFLSKGNVHLKGNINIDIRVPYIIWRFL